MLSFTTTSLSELMKRIETMFPTEPSNCPHKLSETQIYLCREVNEVFLKKVDKLLLLVHLSFVY